MDLFIVQPVKIELINAKKLSYTSFPTFIAQIVTMFIIDIADTLEGTIFCARGNERVRVRLV